MLTTGATVTLVGVLGVTGPKMIGPAKLDVANRPMPNAPPNAAVTNRLVILM